MWSNPLWGSLQIEFMLEPLCILRYICPENLTNDGLSGVEKVWDDSSAMKEEMGSKQYKRQEMFSSLSIIL